MEGNVCVITGANSGVGLEPLKRLAKGGAHIVMVCRNLDKAERISRETKAEWNAPVDVIVADFSRLDYVRDAAALIL